MNFKPNVLKIILSMIISLFATYLILGSISVWHGDYWASYLSYYYLNTKVIINFILTFIGISFGSYIIWSLVQKKK